MIRADSLPYEPPRARLGPARRVVARFFRGGSPVFRRRRAGRARSRRSSGSALGRGLAGPPGAQVRRGGPDPARPALGRSRAARRGRAGEARPGARARGKSLFRVPRWPIAATRCAPSGSPPRRRPHGAARPGSGRGARRLAQGGRGTRPAGPARRGRGRRSGDRPARRRRAARSLLRPRRARQGAELAGPNAAARRRAVPAPVGGRGAAATPGRVRLGEDRGARLRPRGAFGPSTSPRICPAARPGSGT
jgi:hypothetical protein